MTIKRLHSDKSRNPRTPVHLFRNHDHNNIIIIIIFSSTFSSTTQLRWTSTAVVFLAQASVREMDKLTGVAVAAEGATDPSINETFALSWLSFCNDPAQYTAFSRTSAGRAKHSRARAKTSSWSKRAIAAIQQYTPQLKVSVTIPVSVSYSVYLSIRLSAQASREGGGGIGRDDIRPQGRKEGWMNG